MAAAALPADWWQRLLCLRVCTLFGISILSHHYVPVAGTIEKNADAK